MTPAIDTSALAKWYLPEAQSEPVERWIQAHAPLAICSLTRVEFRALLARRRRERSIDALFEQRALAALQDDVESGHLIEHAVAAEDFRSAMSLITQLRSPLRTLDALHLAVFRRLGVVRLATADRVQAEAAEEMGMVVEKFWMQA